MSDAPNPRRRPYPFDGIPDAIATDPRLKAEHKMLVIALDRAAKGRTNCNPTNDHLERYVGPSDRHTLKRYLGKLEECGYIAVTHDRQGVARGQTWRTITLLWEVDPTILDRPVQETSQVADHGAPAHRGNESDHGAPASLTMVRSRPVVASDHGAPAHPLSSEGLRAEKTQRNPSVRCKPEIAPRQRPRPTEDHVSHSPPKPETASRWPEGFGEGLSKCGHSVLQNLGRQILSGELGYSEDRMLALVVIRAGRLGRIRDFGRFIWSLGGKCKLEDDLRALARKILAEKEHYRKVREAFRDQEDDEQQERTEALAAIEELDPGDRERLEQRAAQIADGQTSSAAPARVRKLCSQLTDDDLVAAYMELFGTDSPEPTPAKLRYVGAESQAPDLTSPLPSLAVG